MSEHSNWGPDLTMYDTVTKLRKELRAAEAQRDQLKAEINKILDTDNEMRGTARRDRRFQVMHDALEALVIEAEAALSQPVEEEK